LSRVVAAGALGGSVVFIGASCRDGTLVTLSNIDHKVRPLLASCLPHSTFVWLYSASRPLALKVMSLGLKDSVEDFPAPRTVLGLRFRGDLGNAAGLDKEAALLDFNFQLGAGFAVVGTVLNAPHKGNLFSFLGGAWTGNVWTPLPESGGALNSLGLPSYGIEVPIQNIKDFRQRHRITPQVPGHETPIAKCFPIGVSIMGHPAQDGEQKLAGVVECVKKAIPVADFIEINESCPNVKHGCKDMDGLTERLKAVTQARNELISSCGRRVPILVKLGTVGDAAATVALLAKCGVDGIVAVNTQRDYGAFSMPASDRSLLEHYTEHYAGGLSGTPIKEFAARQVEAVMAAVRKQGLQDKFVVVHVGGLSSEADVRNSRSTGANLRQWYTGMFGALSSGSYSSRDLYPRFTALA